MAHPRPFYYLENFLTALAGLCERYGDLLDETEKDFIDQFRRLPQVSAALLVRMIGRKGDLFRTAKLVYGEIGCPRAAAAPLLALGWLESAGDGFRVGVRPLCDRLQALFFGNFRQDWSEFVLTDLGIFRYETVACDGRTRAFRTRRHIETFYALFACRQQMDAGRDAGSVLASLPPPVEDNDWLERRRQKLQFQLAQLLERERDFTNALEVYQRCACAGSRVRAVRLLERLERIPDAVALACSVREEPVDDSETQQVERMLPRLHRKAGLARTHRSPARRWLTFELALPKAERPEFLEQATAEALSEPGAPVHYVENGLMNSLFGLLCWEAIFAPVPGAFFHEFQSGPADLHTSGFRVRRDRDFARWLGQLEDGAYRDTIRRNFERKRGIRSPFVFWNVLSESLLDMALDCVPPRHLRVCFERILGNVRINRSGWPDLVQLWPGERRYRLIEVKGPGDRLQDNQVRWLMFFEAQGIPVSVCHVSWSGAGA